MYLRKGKHTSVPSVDRVSATPNATVHGTSLDSPFLNDRKADVQFLWPSTPASQAQPRTSFHKIQNFSCTHSLRHFQGGSGQSTGLTRIGASL